MCGGLHPPWPGGIAMTAPVVEVTSGSVSPVAMEAMSSFAYCGVAGALFSALGVQLGSRSASHVLHSVRRVRSTPGSRHTPVQPQTGKECHQRTRAARIVHSA